MFPQHLDQLLREFLQDVRTLESNLRILQATLEDVEGWEAKFGHQRRVRETIAKSFDVLKSICGDFTTTLQDCHRFLKSEQMGILGAAFGLPAQKILRLRGRLQFHSLKIAAAITPLELQLELAFREWLHKALAEIIDVLAKIPQDTARLLVEMSQQTQSEELTPTPVSYDPVIVQRCNLRFEQETSQFDLELLTLERVLGCFLQHLGQSTESIQDSNLPAEQNVSALQFINLVKCKWLINYAKDPRFVERQDTLSYWSLLLTEQEAKVHKQFARFEQQRMSKRINAPALEQVEALPQEVFQLWMFDELLDSTPDQFNGNTILSYSLRESRTGDRQFSIVQTEPHILRLDDVRRAPTNIEYRNESYLDLRVLRLDPVYASADETSNVYNVTYKISRISELRSLTFPCLDSMLHFQHATTGYKVIDQPQVEVELHIDRGVFKTGQKITGTGRLQLWSPGAAENKFVDQHGILRLAQEPVAARDPTSPRRSSTNSSHFTLTGNSSRPSRWALEMATIVPQEVPTTNAFFHKRPKKPLLVFFLSRDNDNQWFKDMASTESAGVCIAIEVDRNTCLDKEACGCKKYPERCKAAMIAPEKGRQLVGYRSIDDGSPGRNLSTLGAYQFQDALRDGRIKEITNLAWASITFPSASGEKVFAIMSNHSLTLGNRSYIIHRKCLFGCVHDNVETKLFIPVQSSSGNACRSAANLSQRS